MNAPELMRQHELAARAEENLAAIFDAHDVETLAALSASIFFEYEGEPVLEVELKTGAIVKSADLGVVREQDVESLLVCHEGRLPFRLELAAYASPSQAVARFDLMAEGLEDDEVEA